MESRSSVLYRMTFASGKSYVGITSAGIKRRINQHRRETVSGRGAALINKAWRKYGEPVVEVLAVVSADDLLHTERRAVAVFGTMHPGGYNMTAGGETSPASSPIVAAKISAAKKGIRPSQKTLDAAHAVTRGMKWTAEQKARLSESRMGRVVSAVTRQKISEAQKGKPRPPDGIRKMAEALKGKKRSPQAIAMSAEKMRGHKWSAESYAKGWETRRTKAMKGE